MKAESLLVPSAILIGAAMIGVGLFLGLRSQSPAIQTPPDAMVRPVETIAPIHSVAPILVASSPVVAAPAAPTDIGSAPAKERAMANAKIAIDAEKKAHWIPKCWTPALAAAKEPATSKYTLSLSFDAEGKQIGQGVSELRDVPSRSDVATCLSRQPMTLSIPQPGTPVSIEIPVEFP